jgi:glutamate N-acetyltransferase / amino-acid N-acetyltransferase
MGVRSMDDELNQVPGFKASAIAAGLKKDGLKDLALFYSETEATTAGVFTTNKVKAAPVLLCMERITTGKARAIIANAGNANACTGKKGQENARFTAELVAKEIGIEPEEVLVASTGVIGAQLNMNTIEVAIPELVKNLSVGGIGDAAEAILTTDSFSKISIFEGKAGDTGYKILGVAKGAGMIMPDMATMLCFILTDIRIGQYELRRALSTSVAETFNRITVDGDTSTNDTVLVLANGMSGNIDLTDDQLKQFTKGMSEVTSELSTMIVKDGEGATKLVFIKVTGAASKRDAEKAARTVANSSLVKTAFYGQDPNWGRIMGALGRSDISMEEDKVSIWIDDIIIVEQGLGLGMEQEKGAAEKMRNSEFDLTIDLRQGDFEFQVTTCDLTHEYVSINADYRT